MSVGPISPSIPAIAAAPAQGEGTAGLSGMFGRLVDDFLATKARDEGQVNQAVLDLALGNSNDFHTVALTAAKADLHFRMVLEVRNRLLDAYTEVMRMQV